MPPTDVTVQPTGSGITTVGSLERTNTRWRVVSLMFILYTINCIDRIALSVGLPVISKEFALTPAMQGFILSAFFWTYCGFQIPGGWLADRFGARIIITATTFLWGSFQCISAAATNGITLMLSRIGLGMFEAPFMPTTGRLTASWLHPRERAAGITLVDSGAPLGSAFGGLIISSLIVFFASWRLAFLSVGILTLIFGFIIYWYLRDRPEMHPGVNKAELQHLEEEKARAGEAPDEMAHRRMSTQTFVFMVIGRIGWAMVFFGLVTWGPNYLAAARGMNIKGMGISTFAMFLSGAAGEIFSGFLAAWLQKRFSRNTAFKILFGISGTVALASLALLPSVADPNLAVLVLSVALFFHFWGGLYWTIPSMLAPREKIGLVGGIMNFAGTSSGITVPIIVGYLVQYTGGFTTVIYFFAGCALAYLIGSMVIDFREQHPTTVPAR